MRIVARAQIRMVCELWRVWLVASRVVTTPFVAVGTNARELRARCIVVAEVFATELHERLDFRMNPMRVFIAARFP